MCLFEWFTKAAIDIFKIATWPSKNSRWLPYVMKQKQIIYNMELNYNINFKTDQISTVIEQAQLRAVVDRLDRLNSTSE